MRSCLEEIIFKKEQIIRRYPWLRKTEEQKRKKFFNVLNTSFVTDNKQPGVNHFGIQ